MLRITVLFFCVYYHEVVVDTLTGFRNSILSNQACQSYKHRETAARGFQVLPLSETTFLVTTSRGAGLIVNLPATEDVANISLSGLQDWKCTCGKYQDFVAPCAHGIACIQYINGEWVRCELNRSPSQGLNRNTKALRDQKQGTECVKKRTSGRGCKGEVREEVGT